MTRPAIYDALASSVAKSGDLAFPDTMIVVTLFLVLLVTKLVAELFLERLNEREIRRNADTVPEAYRDFMDPETYRNSVTYSLAKLRFGYVELLFGAVMLGVVLASGLLAWVYHGLSDGLGMGVWAQALVMVVILTLLSLPSWPLDYWETFRLEQKFGFNKQTPALWFSDKLKVTALSLVIGVPLVALLIGFYRWQPATWWLWGFAALFSFQLLLLVLYPQLILPLFNKLEPLPEGSLRDRLVQLGEKAGFTVTNIHVIDGSKRSTHSNALFTGFGRFRRIIIYDTLIEQLDEAELEAVLAHEIGHYKRGHIPKLLAVNALMSFLGFAMIGFLAEAWPLYEGFGFTYTESSIVPIILILTLAGGLITFWFTPLMSRMSRKHEYEADAFAREMIGNDPQPLIRALRKLHKENKSNLTPHPLYSKFYYSHPTLVEREGALTHG